MATAPRAELVGLAALAGNDAAALALDLPKTMAFEDWVDLGRKLADGQRVVNWWIGDWWATGSHRYGERAKVAAEQIFGREFQTLMNLASVCRSFEPSRRREVLSFTHHLEVAALPPEDADKLLDRAEKEDLSTRQLRVEAMHRKVALGLFKPRDEGDPDPDYTALKGIAAAWNRAPTASRQSFLELAAEADLGVIEV